LSLKCHLLVRSVSRASTLSHLKLSANCWELCSPCRWLLRNRAFSFTSLHCCFEVFHSSWTGAAAKTEYFKVGCSRPSSHQASLQSDCLSSSKSVVCSAVYSSRSSVEAGCRAHGGYFLSLRRSFFLVKTATYRSFQTFQTDWSTWRFEC